MGKRHSPRHGSMQYWPRKRARRIYPRIRSWNNGEAMLLGFIGYKAGMTQISFFDNRKNSPTKNQEIVVPVTVIETPPINVIGLVMYGLKNNVYYTLKTIITHPYKDLARKIRIPKKKEDPEKIINDLKAKIKFVRLLVSTNPSLTGIGKKKPEILEIGVGGSGEEQLIKAKEMLGKQIWPEQIFKNGELVDVHAVTKGKGLQGPVKRFGVMLRAKKSEKTVRGPGSLGPWNAQGHIMYRVAKAGQMGFHTRTEYNKKIMGFLKPDDINPKGGFLRYGLLKNPCILIYGSVPGAVKRPIIITKAIRKPIKCWEDPIEITYIDRTSKQGK